MSENKSVSYEEKVKKDIMEKLKQVIDPEMNMDLVSLGLIYNIKVEEKEKKAIIDMTFTTPTCPLGDMILEDVKFVLSQIKDLESIDINVVFDTPWSPERMSEEAKEKLGFLF